MTLYDMARAYPEMSVTIKLGDLLKANEQLALKVRKDTERRMASKAQGCRLIPRNDVRDMLGVNDSTLWRWEHTYDYLRPVRIGRSVYYRESDLQAIIEDHTEND